MQQERDNQSFSCRNGWRLGNLREMQAQGLPAEAAKAMMDAVDCNAYFFGNSVEVPVMYAIIIGATAVLLGVYVMLNRFKKTK